MLAAFGFSKLHIRGREIYFWMMLAALTLPEVVLLTPLFSTAIKLGLYNTYFSVILPLAALQIPFCVLLTRNFVNGIPDELLRRRAGRRRERGADLLAHHPAAHPADRRRHRHLDPDRGLERLPAPAGLPADARATETITLLPSFFVSEFSDDQTKVVASAVITAIPEIVAYLCLQRLFERGLTAGALK